MSFELDRLFIWLFLALAILAFLVLFFICAAFFVVYVIDRFFNWLDRRLFPALTILTLLNSAFHVCAGRADDPTACLR